MGKHLQVYLSGYKQKYALLFSNDIAEVFICYLQYTSLAHHKTLWAHVHYENIIHKFKNILAREAYRVLCTLEHFHCTVERILLGWTANCS